MDEITKEKDEEDSTNIIVDKKEHSVMKTTTSCGLNEEMAKEKDEEDSTNRIV